MAPADANIWISSAAPILQAAAVAVTAFYASRGLQTWRKQLLGKRRMEVAEEALVAFRQAMEAINRIRSTPHALSQSEAAVTGFDVNASGRAGYREQLKQFVEYEEVWQRLAHVQELCIYYLPTGAHAAVNKLWCVVRRVKDGIQFGITVHTDLVATQSQAVGRRTT